MYKLSITTTCHHYFKILNTINIIRIYYSLFFIHSGYY